MSKVLISFDGPGSVQVYEPVAPQTPFSPDQSVLPTETISQAVDQSFPTARQSQAETVASVEKNFVNDGPIARMFRRFVINHVVQETGRSEAEVRDAVAKVESTGNRPLLNWLTNGGLQQLIALIVQILGILGKVA